MKNEFRTVNWITEHTHGEGVRSIEDAMEIISNLYDIERWSSVSMGSDNRDQVVERVFREIHRIGYEKGYENGKEDLVNGA